MAVATTNTYVEYVASAGQTIFNFSGLTYFEGDGNSLLYVFVDDVSGPTWVITEGSATEGIVTGGTLTFDVARTAGEVIKIQRITPRTQPTVFSANYNKTAVSKTSDRTVMQLQEIEDEGATPVVSEVHSLLPDWDTGTSYVVFEQVLYRTVAPLQQNVYRCLVDHTSTNFAQDLLDGYWEFVYLQGIEGAQGVQGNQGPQGIQGVQGIQGNAGNDGIFATVATQPEAEAGVENTHGMTPLRTAQAIDFQVPNLTVITDHETRIGDLETQVSANTNNIASNLNKIEALENLICDDTYNGSQPIENNEAVPQPLLGKDLGVTGNGVPLAVSSVGTQLVRFTLQILREDGVDTRFEQQNIALHFIGSTWYLGVEQRIILDGDLGGVTLSIVTTPDGGGGFIGQVYYVSDDMTGGSYTSRIKWIGREISVGV